MYIDVYNIYINEKNEAILLKSNDRVRLHLSDMEECIAYMYSNTFVRILFLTLSKLDVPTAILITPAIFFYCTSVTYKHITHMLKLYQKKKNLSIIRK